MSNFSVDYKYLSNNVNKKSFKLSDVKHRIEKVAFDVVRFKDTDIETLWQIQNSEDGEYIVALYNEEINKKIASSERNDWEVIVSEASGDLNILYRGDLISKIASSKLGVPVDEISLVKRYLPKKLAANKTLVKALLNELSESTRKLILAKYPELS